MRVAFWAVLCVFISYQRAHTQQPVRLLVERDGRISWVGQYTHSYQLQASPRLEGPGWTNVGPAILGGGGTNTVTNAFANGSQLFYRLLATNAFRCASGAGTNCDSSLFLGSFAGDTLMRQGLSCVPAPCTQVAERFGCGSAWFRLRLLENSDCAAALRVKAELHSPPGVNYDLFLYLEFPQEPCGSLRAVSQRGAGQLDVVVNGPPDLSFADDSTTVWIEVRYISGSELGDWYLRLSTRACSE